MTTQAPDPREFKTWEDAFQYPVPVVRRLEQQLRGNVNENREKLRSLVGTSYRDLLSTAERIIDMDGQMHQAEDLLSDIGRKCNARAIERIAANHARTVKSQKERNSGRNALASTLALLQSCITIGTRLIKRGGSTLLAAKLLVIARLLHSNASKSPQPPPLLATLRTRLASFRRKALSQIDKTLAHGKVDRDELTEALAAFSLATTSTPTDVLRHFLNTRAEALTDILEEPTESGVQNAMILLLTTLKDAQTVFPRRLADLLARLQDEPLLHSNAVRATPELDLDIHERWIAEDVRNFTPYLRYDQLQASQTTKIVGAWAGSAKERLIEGLKRLLRNMTDAPKVMELRKDIIQRALAADRKLPGLNQAAFFEELRVSFVHGLQGIAVNTAQNLPTIVGDFLDSDSTEGTEDSSADIWDISNAEIDLSKGAVEFRKLIVHSSQGKDSRLLSLDHSLKVWSSHMAGLSATIKGMREDRWDDDLDLDLDDDLELHAPQDLLTKEDPASLHSLLNEQKNKALSSVYEQMQSSIAEKARHDLNSAFLLRVLREVLRHSSASESSSAKLAKPPNTLLDKLYSHLARQVMEPTAAFRRLQQLIPFSQPPFVTLWEGTPALPAQPSPACFRFLHETCKTMKEIGGDLWTPSAVDVLKIQLLEFVAKSVVNTTLKQEVKSKTTEADGKDDGEENAEVKQGGDEARDEKSGSAERSEESLQHQKVLQTLYDALYLEKVLGSPTIQDLASFEKVSTQLRGESGLEEAALERMRKSATDYYKRTYLLFGLLAA